MADVAFIEANRAYYYFGLTGKLHLCNAAHPSAACFATKRDLIGYAFQTEWLCGNEPPPPILTSSERKLVTILTAQPSRYINYRHQQLIIKRTRHIPEPIQPLSQVKKKPNWLIDEPPAYNTLFDNNISVLPPPYSPRLN